MNNFFSFSAKRKNVFYMQKCARLKTRKGPTRYLVLSLPHFRFHWGNFLAAFVLISAPTTGDTHRNRRHRRVISDFVSRAVRDNLGTVHSGSTWLCRLRKGLCFCSERTGRSSKGWKEFLCCFASYASTKTFWNRCARLLDKYHSAQRYFSKKWMSFTTSLDSNHIFFLPNYIPNDSNNCCMKIRSILFIYSRTKHQKLADLGLSRNLIEFFNIIF